jgi:hypothetical protein
MACNYVAIRPEKLLLRSELFDPDGSHFVFRRRRMAVSTRAGNGVDERRG